MKIHSTTPHTPGTDTSFFHWPEDDLSWEEADRLLEPYLHEDNRKKHVLRDFFSRHFDQYCLSHRISKEKFKVMHSLISCKTGRLGYTLTRCGSCGQIRIRACSCGNRNCPSCGYLNEKRWVALRQAEVIPGIPYFHLVFTLPHELSVIMYQNQRETLNLLFRSVEDTILTMSENNLKMTPGILIVLHTFGSSLAIHYHLHVLVSGGGLTSDRTDFKRCLSRKFFLPVKAVKEVYRGKFMDGLKQLHDTDALNYDGEAQKYRNSYTWKELLNACYGVEWNVEIRPLSPVGDTKKGEEGTDNAISYFARYTNRTAISDNRVESYDDQHIRFRYKDYDGKDYTWKTMELTAEEFIRRFLMHILPKGFARIRYAGFLAGCTRKNNLHLIHELLGMELQEPPVKDMDSAELIRHFFGRDVTVCEICHGQVDILPRIRRLKAVHMIRAS